MNQVGQKGLLYTTDILASTLFVDGWTRLGLEEIVMLIVMYMHYIQVLRNIL